jgi:hypothetical protein
MRTHGLSRDATYKVWQAMHQRCTNPKCGSFKDYGERGISVCKEWQTFEGFIMDMGLSPPGHTLDRIDNDSGYSKSNCRWVSMQAQNQNRRTTRLNRIAVAEIRRRVKSGEKARDVAERFAVSEPTISMIVNGHTWKNVS